MVNHGNGGFVFRGSIEEAEMRYGKEFKAVTVRTIWAGSQEEAEQIARSRKQGVSLVFAANEQQGNILTFLSAWLKQKAIGVAAGAIIVLMLATFTMAESNQCVIVRGGENHRVRNAAIFGVLTGGIGLGAGALLSGTSYERVDAIGDVPFKLKYKGKDLKKFQAEGIHIVVVSKNEPIPNTRMACGIEPAPAPAPVSAENKKLEWEDMTMQKSAVVITPAPRTPLAICVETLVDKSGDMMCLRWADKPGQ